MQASWYQGVPDKKPKECDLMCAMIYSIDPVNCRCVPIPGMECHPQYNPPEDCKQTKNDDAECDAACEKAKEDSKAAEAAE